MKWSELVRRAGPAGTWPGGADPEVTAVVEDSRQVRPGACFVAVRGTRQDGHAFIHQAVQAGAVAVVCERPVEVPPGVAVARVASTWGWTGRLAAALHGLDHAFSSGELQLVGITGTNGKSTFCYLVRSILRRAGMCPAMFGTVEYDLVSRRVTADQTTPPAAALMGYMAEARQAGATHAVMEVSSHALDQGRVEGLRFAVAAFSNLTGDHLDYHGTMEAYLRAKKRLFDGLDDQAVAVINADDPAGERMIADCRARVLRYGIVEPATAEASTERLDILARIEAITAGGSRFELCVRPPGSGPGSCRQTCHVDSPLVGRHNVQNCLAAAGAGLALGLDLDTVVAGLLAQRTVPGRLQRVESPVDDITVLVDYAHTDDALVNVLSTLRPLAAGRLVVVFGCGGDRDATKRPRMARAAAGFADRIIVTSDNPRTEDPQRIIEDILAGFTPADMSRVIVEPDRRRAIGLAIEQADPGDVILLAGKGHENYQIIGTRKIHFDDAEVAAGFLSRRAAAGRGCRPGQEAVFGGL